MTKEKKISKVKTTETIQDLAPIFLGQKCPRCGNKGAVLQGTSLLSLERWRNLKELRLLCVGLDKRKPPRKPAAWERVPTGHEYPDCHQTYKLKIKVLGIEPE